MKTKNETAGKTAKREIIKEISNTLWRHTNSAYSNGVEITQNLNGVEIVATIDTWPNGAMLEINGKKYRTRKGSTLKRDIVDIVTMWVDELTKVEEQPTKELEKILANEIINLIEIEKQENNNKVVSLVLKREDVNSMAHEMGMSKIMFVCHVEEYLKNHFEEKGIYVCWRFDSERNFEFQFIGKEEMKEKRFDITTKQVIDYIEDYVEFDEGCLYMTQEEWLGLIGAECLGEITTDDGWVKENVIVTFDGKEIFEEPEIPYSICAVMAKYGKEHFGGKWETHWCDGAIAAWDKNITSAGEIFGF